MADCPNSCYTGNSARASVQLGDRRSASRTVSKRPSRAWALTTTRGKRLPKTALHGEASCRQVPVQLKPGASKRHRPNVPCAKLELPLLPHQHPPTCVPHAGGHSEPGLDSPATMNPLPKDEPSMLEPSLTAKQRRILTAVLKKLQGVLSGQPGQTTLVSYKIKTLTREAVRVPQYSLPHSKLETVEQEVQVMLRLGVIQPASSPFNAPVILVKKKDGSTRFCVDFHQMNNVTDFYAKPMPNAQ